MGKIDTKQHAKEVGFIEVHETTDYIQQIITCIGYD
jgi:hypothetical protein